MVAGQADSEERLRGHTPEDRHQEAGAHLPSFPVAFRRERPRTSARRRSSEGRRLPGDCPRRGDDPWKSNPPPGGRKPLRNPARSGLARDLSPERDPFLRSGNHSIFCDIQQAIPFCGRMEERSLSEPLSTFRTNSRDTFDSLISY